jgi:hypothetical protein
MPDESALWREAAIQMSRVQVPGGGAWIRPGRPSLTVRNDISNRFLNLLYS